MASNKQQAVDQIWEKYRRTLEMLDEALQENEQLKQQLDEIDWSPDIYNK